MRSGQKQRTRHAILGAAGALLQRGRKPSLDEIAEAAQVSRATAYRYFPGLDTLLSEAAGELMLPDDADLFTASAPSDPFERIALIDDILDRACREQEVALRLALARRLERSIDHARGEPPLRRNRRVPLLEQALAPLAARLGRPRLARLAQALAIVVGPEGFLALNDVVGLDEGEAREVRRWAIDALVAAALSETYSAG